MNSTPFSELSLLPEIRRAIEAMGFDTATAIQAQSIPLIQSGRDVIGRSQTGTGKTVAFGIPALEILDTQPSLRGCCQVLILCPTRELAVQACGEIRKLARFLPGIQAVEVYGGAPMDRQILRLKTANLVVGTPGRVMDHMRRGTLRLDHLKMIVLDEADEMLSMGFREDIETILAETPEDRQTVLFSATMPPAILAITRAYQRDPALVQIQRRQETVENIAQSYVDVPMGRKLDALRLILRYENPRLAMIFCNTKRMVDEVTDALIQQGFPAEGLHGDMNQSQRTKVMEGFKHGRIGLLVATDVAARGIDVSGIEYVINYDIPQSTEYYVHRIGRTGRAGKSGKAITLCSGRRQVGELLQIGRLVKAGIERAALPTPAQIRERGQERLLSEMAEALAQPEENAPFSRAVETLAGQGYPPEAIAAAALRLAAGEGETDLEEIPPSPAYRPDAPHGGYRKICINIGREKNVAPNHIVAAIAGRTGMQGRDIGKIEIYDDETIVAIPAARFDDTLEAMAGCKIVGTPTETRAFTGGVSFPAEASRSAGHGGKDYRRLPKRRGAEGRGRKPR